jgi:hypothetical protein
LARHWLTGCRKPIEARCGDPVAALTRQMGENAVAIGLAVSGQHDCCFPGLDGGRGDNPCKTDAVAEPLLDPRSCDGNARQYDPSLRLFEKHSDRALTCRFVADVIAIGAATQRHAFVLSVALFFHFILTNVDHGDSGSLACDEAKGGEGDNED